MRICIVGKSKVGKTRFCSALLNKPYINSETIDFHEWKLDTLIIIDTPSSTEEHFQQLPNYKPDLCFVFINGSEGISSSDLECINQIRKFNIPFEIIVGFGQDNLDESLLPNNITIHYISSRNDIDDFREQLIINYDTKNIQSGIDSINEDIDLSAEAMDDINDLGNNIKKDTKLKWILVGKENAGKSTLLNALVGHNRAKVSPIPGTTKASIEIETEDLQLKDTAGVKRSNLNYINHLLEKQALVIFVIDGSKDLTHTDKHLIGQVMESGLACVIALNKADHENFSQLPGYQLQKVYKFIPIVEISAQNGENIPTLIKVCNNVESKAVTRITTSKLNKWVEAEKHLFHGCKIKYACHTNISPYEVVFFIAPMTKNKSVISHLRNLFQKFFDLKGVCVKVVIKAARSTERAANISEEQKELRKQRHQTRKMGQKPAKTKGY